METLVLYPSPGMGHLISMVELGKFILHHYPSLSITILTVPPSFNTGSTATYIRHISATVPSITFHHLPPISLYLESFPSMESIIFEVLNRSNPHVRRALETISLSATISAFIIDMFCTCVSPIAAQLNIPTYYFFTSGACSLAFFLYFPTIHNTTTKSFRDMNALLHVPGIPPTPSSDITKPVLDRDTTDYENFLNFAKDLPNSAGIIVNTFESLETRPLKAIREGKCNPGGHTPPVFSIGPLLATEVEGNSSGVRKKWAEVSMGCAVATIRRQEQAVFTTYGTGLGLPPPAGFLDRTKDRGLVLKSWAPQVAVLNHESVGGFVTHCGWNSVLEAVCAAVPMVAWPLYAEQKMNRVVLVEDMKVALGMEVAEDDFVVAEEVERRVRELMESEKGREIRKVVEEMSVEGKGAMREGGSSIAALAKLLESSKPA
ncbi:UDP-glycosyltransferase 88B1 [Sesamum angolense]|uniref:Glycosyltransferase n=1 Tax=Sesamum angolense TaxID=2727404 RepID=A0AAE1TD60_9LAMI|nr:UDP-glycosyltransferase 88B1 [Sesamum angolense]